MTWGWTKKDIIYPKEVNSIHTTQENLASKSFIDFAEDILKRVEALEKKIKELSK